MPAWLMAAAVLLVLAGAGGYLELSNRGPFGPDGDPPTMIPAAVPPTDGGQAIISPIATLVPTPTVVIAPTMPTDHAASVNSAQFIVVLQDISYDPATLEVPANVPIEIVLINEGAAPHSFFSAGLTDPVYVEPGRLATVGLTLEPGVYEFYCFIPGHQEAGMVGQIIATSDGDSESGSAGEPPTDLRLELLDIRFDPSELSIPANAPSTLELVNNGAAPHNLSIPDLGISVDVPPGGREMIAIDAPPGTYTMFCDIQGHREAGMVGTLNVN